MLKKEKQNANPVGAAISRPHFEGITLKNPKGITLIALIITIIVMLILVGVTINVALNGGLFTKASDASKQMQVEADRETLLSAVVAAIGYDGKVVIADIELPTGWTGSNGTYTSPKGNTFTVDENGKITGGNIAGGNENTKTPLKQIKHGDVWTDVSFASMTLSNTGITLPVTEYVERLDIANSTELEEPIQVELNIYEFCDDDENFIITYVGDEDATCLQVHFPNEDKLIIYYFSLPEDAPYSINTFYCLDMNGDGNLEEMTEEEVNNIKLSGTINMEFKENINSTEFNGEGWGYYDAMPAQMASWFSGEVEYVD